MLVLSYTTTNNNAILLLQFTVDTYSGKFLNLTKIQREQSGAYLCIGECLKPCLNLIFHDSKQSSVFHWNAYLH